jgi:hypothetical protein
MQDPYLSEFKPLPLSVAMPLLVVCFVMLVYSHEIAEKLVAFFTPKTNEKRSA